MGDSPGFLHPLEVGVSIVAESLRDSKSRLLIRSPQQLPFQQGDHHRSGAARAARSAQSPPHRCQRKHGQGTNQTPQQHTVGNSTSGGDRPGARGTGPRCAPKTVGADDDRSTVQKGLGKISDVSRKPRPHWQLQHLIKITIVQAAIPTDRDHLAAHHTVDRRRVEGRRPAPACRPRTDPGPTGLPESD